MPFEPWTRRPKFVESLDPQATARLVNLLVNEICHEIEDLVSSVKSLPPGKQQSRRAGELEAMLAVIHRMEDHGIVKVPVEGGGDD